MTGKLAPIKTFSVTMSSNQIEPQTCVLEDLMEKAQENLTNSACPSDWSQHNLDGEAFCWKLFPNAHGPSARVTCENVGAIVPLPTRLGTETRIHLKKKTVTDYSHFLCEQSI